MHFLDTHSSIHTHTPLQRQTHYFHMNLLEGEEPTKSFHPTFHQMKWLTLKSNTAMLCYTYFFWDNHLKKNIKNMLSKTWISSFWDLLCLKSGGRHPKRKHPLSFQPRKSTFLLHICHILHFINCKLHKRRLTPSFKCQKHVPITVSVQTWRARTQRSQKQSGILSMKHQLLWKK